MRTALEAAPIQRESPGHGNLNAKELGRLDHYIAQYKKEGPRIDQFSGLRPQIELERDQQVIRMREAEFKHKNPLAEQYATALEMVLMDFSSNWLPGFLSKASAYDDYFNQTDLVLEMHDDWDRALRIAIDITSNPEKTRNKVGKIIDNLRKGTLSQLKYFISELDDSTDKKEIPRVIVGSDNIEQISQLIRLYIQQRDAQDVMHRNAFRRAISEHPIGRQITQEIIYQLQRSVRILKTADAPEDVIDEKVAMIEATIATLEEFAQKKTTPINSSSEDQGRNRLLTIIQNAFATT